MVWYLAVRVRRPEVAQEVGSTEEEPVPPGGSSRTGPGTGAAAVGPAHQGRGPQDGGDRAERPM
jgi:hypothetical protein